MGRAVSGWRRVWRVVRAILVTVMAGALLVGGIVVKDTYVARLARVDVQADGITAGRPLRILQVSDFHDLGWQRQIDSITRRAVDEKPDLVVLTGDVVHTGTTDFSHLTRLAQGLVASGAPVVFIWGNHDHWNRHFSSRVLSDAGVKVLVDEHMPLDGPWGRVDLVGTDDYYSRHGHLPKAAEGLRKDATTVVLTHALDKALPDISVVKPELVLSGHTHGGQVRVPLYGAIMLPGQKQYDRGVFHLANGTTAYIDQGAGCSGPPVRFWAASQVTLLEVHA